MYWILYRLLLTSVWRRRLKKDLKLCNEIRTHYFSNGNCHFHFKNASFKAFNWKHCINMQRIVVLSFFRQYFNQGLLWTWNLAASLFSNINARITNWCGKTEQTFLFEIWIYITNYLIWNKLWQLWVEYFSFGFAQSRINS